MGQLVPNFPLEFSIDRTAAGYRLLAPKSGVHAIEARTIDELIGKLVQVVWRTVEDAEGLKALDPAEEEQALQKLAATALDRRSLEAMAAKYPVPREWGDEPDWSDAL